MKVISIERESAIADIGGVTQEISIELLDKVKVGDYVIVHTGFAISKVKQKDAKETLSLLKEIQKIDNN